MNRKEIIVLLLVGMTAFYALSTMKEAGGAMSIVSKTELNAFPSDSSSDVEQPGGLCLANSSARIFQTNRTEKESVDERWASCASSLSLRMEQTVESYLAYYSEVIIHHATDFYSLRRLNI